MYKRKALFEHSWLWSLLSWFQWFDAPELIIWREVRVMRESYPRLNEWFNNSSMKAKVTTNFWDFFLYDSYNCALEFFSVSNKTNFQHSKASRQISLLPNKKTPIVSSFASWILIHLIFFRTYCHRKKYFARLENLQFTSYCLYFSPAYSRTVCLPCYFYPEKWKEKKNWIDQNQSKENQSHGFKAKTNLSVEFHFDFVFLLDNWTATEFLEINRRIIKIGCLTLRWTLLWRFVFILIFLFVFLRRCLDVRNFSGWGWFRLIHVTSNLA